LYSLKAPVKPEGERSALEKHSSFGSRFSLKREGITAANVTVAEIVRGCEKIQSKPGRKKKVQESGRLTPGKKKEEKFGDLGTYELT